MTPCEEYVAKREADDAALAGVRAGLGAGGGTVADVLSHVPSPFDTRASQDLIVVTPNDIENLRRLRDGDALPTYFEGATTEDEIDPLRAAAYDAKALETWLSREGELPPAARVAAVAATSVSFTTAKTAVRDAVRAAAGPEAARFVTQATICALALLRQKGAGVSGASVRAAMTAGEVSVRASAEIGAFHFFGQALAEFSSLRSMTDVLLEELRKRDEHIGAIELIEMQRRLEPALSVVGSREAGRRAVSVLAKVRAARANPNF
jgi:hypothetical protein